VSIVIEGRPIVRVTVIPAEAPPAATVSVFDPAASGRSSIRNVPFVCERRVIDADAPELVSVIVAGSRYDQVPLTVIVEPPVDGDPAGEVITSRGNDLRYSTRVVAEALRPAALVARAVMMLSPSVSWTVAVKVPSPACATDAPFTVSAWVPLPAVPVTVIVSPPETISPSTGVEMAICGSPVTR
jgi:hypothetical protein